MSYVEPLHQTFAFSQSFILGSNLTDFDLKLTQQMYNLCVELYEKCLCHNFPEYIIFKGNINLCDSVSNGNSWSLSTKCHVVNLIIILYSNQTL